MRIYLVWVALVITICLFAATTHASPIPAPMRDATDNYAYKYAAYQEWDYVDRSAVIHGDYRRARFTLIYNIPQDDPNVTFTMEVEARTIRCGPGWYVVSTPDDINNCHPVNLKW